MPGTFVLNDKKNKKMKNLLKLIVFPSVFLFFASCEMNENCEIGNVAIDCEKADVYNTFVQKEQAINSTFDKFAKRLSIAENLELRKDIVQYYEQNNVELQSVYEMIKDSIFGSRSPKEIFEMRNEEINYFSGEMEKRAESKVFIKTLNISELKLDSTLYEGGDSYVFWEMKIHNTSDSTITGVLVDKIYEVNGEMILPDNPTSYLLSKDMIAPTPMGDPVVRPNDTLILTFDYSKEGMPKPDILRFFFK